jgi:septum formation protein
MIDETTSKRMPPSELALQMAIRKAEAVVRGFEGRWILGADTIVVINRNVFGKPRDPQECYNMLARLSGRSHRVITGLCITDPDGTQRHAEAVMTSVKMKKLSNAEIEAYIKTGEPLGKAGGYAIQGIGSFMIERIKGSYTNVVGLPVCEVVSALVRYGGLRSFPLIE